MLEYVIIQCPLANQEANIFLDFEWSRGEMRSALDLCVCLEGQSGKCNQSTCRFNRQSTPDKRVSPFTEQLFREMLTLQRPKIKAKHRTPERLRHVFDAFGIESRATPNEVLQLKDGRGYVYVIQCLGLTKIGVAENVEARFSALQVGNPTPLRLVNSFASASPLDDEQALHDRFAKYHTRGEWFNLPPRIVNRLSRLKDLQGLRRSKEFDV